MNSEALHKALDTELKRKASHKFREVFSLEDSVVPDRTVVEQASGSPAAEFAAGLIQENSLAADLTAGLGVNTFYLSRRARKVYALECEPHRAQALRQNMKLAGVNNVEVINDRCENWLRDISGQLDAVFVDPSRRGSDHSRKIFLEDCSPRLSDVIALLRDRCSLFLVKASPLLDIHSVAKDYEGVEGFYIIEFQGEVKELLIRLNLSAGASKAPADIFVKSVILKKEGCPEIREGNLKETEEAGKFDFLNNPEEIKAGAYLYDPAPSIRKGALYKVLQETFPSISKLGVNTQLFFSTDFIKDFPGRVFKVMERVGNKDLKGLKGTPFSIISKNHPVTPEFLAQKYKFKNSEKNFLIATTIGNKKVILRAERVK